MSVQNKSLLNKFFDRFLQLPAKGLVPIGQHIPIVPEGPKIGKTRNATQKSNGKQIPISEPKKYKLEFVFLGKGHKQPNLFDDSDEEDIDPMVGFKMPPILMHGLFGGSKLGREEPEFFV